MKKDELIDNFDEYFTAGVHNHLDYVLSRWEGGDSWTYVCNLTWNKLLIPSFRKLKNIL